MAYDIIHCFSAPVPSQSQNSFPPNTTFSIERDIKVEKGGYIRRGENNETRSLHGVLRKQYYKIKNLEAIFFVLAKNLLENASITSK